MKIYKWQNDIYNKSELRWKNHYTMGPTSSQTSNISHTLAGNKIVDHSDVVGESPIGTAPTTFSFLT